LPAGWVGNFPGKTNIFAKNPTPVVSTIALRYRLDPYFSGKAGRLKN
jgi:hypothetical protein